MIRITIVSAIVAVSSFYLLRPLFLNKMSNAIHLMSVEELSILLQDKPVSTTFIDVREYDELKEQGAIKGYNENIPWFLTNSNPESFDKRFSGIDKEDQVNIYTVKIIKIETMDY